jgi:AcrR family transcriptional regulator
MAPKLRTNPRKQPRQQRSQETVDAILSATAQVLVRAGYEGANTNRIAQVAGVSVGSLYQYFPSKEALVAALIERHSEAMWRLIVESTVKVAAAPLPDAVREVIGAIFAAHAVDAKLSKVLREQVPRVGALRQMNEINQRCIALVEGNLEARRAEILPRDAGLAAYVIVHMVDALAHAALERPADLHSGALLDETTAAVLRYLLGSLS